MITLLKTFALTGGEWVIYILILCSVVAIAVMIERAIILFKEQKQLKIVKELFENAIENGKLENESEKFDHLQGLSARVLFTGLSRRVQGVSAVEEYTLSVTSREKQRLERRMLILGTLGNNAIYIGLFGTVLGVIKAFHDLAQESNAGPEVVMQGLSEALIATAVGLMVALPCVVAYNYFQKQIKDLLLETETMVRLLLAYLKSQEKNREIKEEMLPGRKVVIPDD